MAEARSRTGATAWNLFFHYAAVGLMIVSGLVLVPFYLKFIPVQDYGAWLATGNVLVWLTAVDPGLSAVLQQRVGFAYGRGDHAQMGRVIASGLVLALALALLPVAIAFFAGPHLPGWLRLSSDVNSAVLVKAFLLAGLGTTFAVVSFSLAAVNQGLLSSLGMGLIYVVVHTLDIAVTLFLLYRGWGIMAIAFSFVLRGGGLMLGNGGYLAWRLAREKISLSFSAPAARELARVLSFTFFSKAGTLIATNMESFLVARFVGVQYVTILALTRKSLDIGRIAVERPPLAFMPAVSHLFGAGEIAKVRENLLRLFRMLFWAAGLIAAGVYLLNSSFVSLWVGSEFFAGTLVTALLCLNFLLSAMQSSLSNLVLALGDIRKNSLALFLQSVLYVVLAAVLGRAYGIKGIVLASVISMGLISSWYYPRSVAGLIQLPAQDARALLREAAGILLVAAAAVAVFSYFPSEGLPAFLVCAGLFTAAYFFGLLAVSPGFRQELRLARAGGFLRRGGAEGLRET